MPLQSSDIGLVLASDVGDVLALQTTSKQIVAAINELLSSSTATTEQKYIQGEGNKIKGSNNIIYGNNNIVIGKDNIIVGDNLIIIGDNKKIDSKSDFYVYGYEVSTKAAYYDDIVYQSEVNVGDTIALSLDFSYVHNNNNNWLYINIPTFITTIASKGSGYFIITDSPTTPTTPEGYYLDAVYANKFSILKDSWKVTGNGSVVMGYSSKGANSLSANNGIAEGNFSCALNGGVSFSESSFTANYGRATGNSSAALNSGETYAPYSTALNEAFAYGGYSTALNCARTAGRPIKCVSLNCLEQSITAMAGEDLSNLIGTYIIARYKNNNNSIIHNYTKVTNVVGLKIYVENSLGGGSWGEELITDGYIFRAEEYLSYNLATGYAMAGNRYSQAHGLYTLAVHEGSVIYGKYGVTPESYSFALANGTAFTSMGLAAKILQNGNMFIDGTYSSPAADYAELFEWEDGNQNSEDRVGYFVTLVGDKIKKATLFEPFVLGVVSGNPAILGDNAEFHWNEKFQTDDFGRVLYQDVIVPAITEEREFLNENGIAQKKTVIIQEEQLVKQPVLNPNWDSTKEYIPRLKRKEWSAVGVLGKLIVYDDGTCEVGGFCQPNEDGKATKSLNSGYRVLKRVADDKIVIWFK